MKKILLLLLLSPAVYANEQSTCEVLEGVAQWIMTERQEGNDINQYLNSGEQLNENQHLLLTDMISNANEYPVFAIDLVKQQAIDNFKKQWEEDCERSSPEN